MKNCIVGMLLKYLIITSTTGYIAVKSLYYLLYTVYLQCQQPRHLRHQLVILSVEIQQLLHVFQYKTLLSEI